jgi:hypothetical protein
MEISHAMNGSQVDSEESSTMHHEKKMKHKKPKIKRVRPTNSSRGLNRSYTT